MRVGMDNNKTEAVLSGISENASQHTSTRREGPWDPKGITTCIG